MMGPDIRPLDLAGVIEILPKRHGDGRGWFAETWRDDWLDVRFVQDNQSKSNLKGTIRGLHFQLAPASQEKLVRVIRGSVFDVAVDVRRESPSFGKWTGLVLSADAGNSLFIPSGFAHGFMTLEDSSEVVYKVSAPYSAERERAVRFDDPAIGIQWPAIDGPLFLSDRDRHAPLLSDVADEL